MRKNQQQQQQNGNLRQYLSSQDITLWCIVLKCQIRNNCLDWV